jgi:FkbM family methyltransferase
MEPPSFKNYKINRVSRIVFRGGVRGIIKTFRKHFLLWWYKIFYCKKGLMLKKIHDYNMYLDLSQPGISGTLAVFGAREKPETEVFKKELKEGMHVLDIGSNIGYYALLAASIVGDKGKVYAFEPDPRDVELLKKNININNFSHIIKFYPWAVSDKNGYGRFYLTESTNLSTMIARDGEKLNNFIEVKTIKIDDFKEKEKVDFIRMDIEGYECLVLDGMMNLLETTRKPIKLLIERHPSVYDDKEFNFDRRLKKISELGFYIKYLMFGGGKKTIQNLRNRGYEPKGLVREDIEIRGWCENVKMEDLLNKKVRARTILLEKK